MKLKLSVKIQIVAWSLYWLSLLLINLLYFQQDDYSQPLVILWTILYTLVGAGLFYLLIRLYGSLLEKKSHVTLLVIVSVILSFTTAYIWKLFEPLISWLINPQINQLVIIWDVNQNGAFVITFLVGFFSALFFYSKTLEQLKEQKALLAERDQVDSQFGQTISVSIHNEIVLLAVADIKKISIEGNYSIILDKNEQEYELKKSLKKWEDELSSKNFKRIHRSILINTSYIEKIEYWQNSSLRIMLKGSSEPEYASRRYAALLKQELKIQG